jgi:CheY-like chemotaxis protein
MEVAVKLLQMVNFTVVCAENGQEAVELYEKGTCQ